MSNKILESSYKAIRCKEYFDWLRPSTLSNHQKKRCPNKQNDQYKINKQRYNKLFSTEYSTSPAPNVTEFIENKIIGLSWEDCRKRK